MTGLARTLVIATFAVVVMASVAMVIMASALAEGNPPSPPPPANVDPLLPPPPPPGPPPDVSPPKVHALRASGRLGHALRLRYTASDDFGYVAVIADVYWRNGGKTFTRGYQKVEAGRIYFFSWRPWRRGVEWCAQARDLSGQKTTSCATVRVK